MIQKNILQFWREVEIFSLPDFDFKNAILLEKKAPFPWEIKKKSKEDKKWQYTITFGNIPKASIIEEIKKSLPKNVENQWEESISGKSCFSVLILDENGQPNTKSYTLASFVFGLKALRENSNMEVVYSDLQNVSDEYLERYNITKFSNEENSKGEKITWTSIEKEIQYLKKLNPWYQDEIKVYFAEYEVSKKSQNEASTFLNSFYLDDLNKLIDKQLKLSSTLQKYLTLNPNQPKRDLIKDKNELFRTISPEYLTEGKWASNPKYGLCTAQLGAVNMIFKDLKHIGIQGVNGPPGTGKTTLLLDVIAQIVVDRAKQIIELGSENIFGKYNKIDINVSKFISIYELNSALRKNFGIVVASNNNSAVENISKELPQKKKIDIKAFLEADYFSEFAKDFTDEENWGILAAPLGNSENKVKFHNLFWKSFVKNEHNKFEIDKTQTNFYNFLERNQTFEQQNKKDFELSKKQFSILLDKFRSFKKIAIEFHNKYEEFCKNKSQKITLEKVKYELIKDIKSLSESIIQLKTNKQNTKNQIENLKTIIDTLHHKKPLFFFFHKLFGTQSFIKWNEEAGGFIQKFNDFSSEIEKFNSEINQLQIKKENLEKLKESYDYQLNIIQEFIKKYNELKIKLTNEYGIEEKNLFDENFIEKDLKEIHLLSPYHSEKIAQLRSEIFLKALDVHKYAILTNAKQFKNNLDSFFQMLLGGAKISEELTTILWDSFFFCIPVVSTSLASASRLFPNMTENQIGWLLIDEAGQATPQSVAGLVQRSKRCVIVGDPLQVEPVVTIPKVLVEKLRENHNVMEIWSPCNTSVQQLADRISEYGTLMGNSDEGIWTGFPLRTHRRCFNPMFDIANKIAYNDQMVKGTKDEDNQYYIGKSCWFDIQGEGVGDNQVIPNEIEFLKLKIKELRENGYQDEIYVISPFKAVANQCRKEFQRSSKIACGTIHTFQGKEADVIFLVLGSQPKSEGSRKWASSKPNMLNVALTRAKKRCYIIGNKELWGQQPYFSVMGKVLKMK